MGDILNNIYIFIMEVINGSVIYGPLFACLLIFLESIIPVLPLFVFITIIFISYGYKIGFIIAYILTCLGCFLSFFLCRTIIKKMFKNKIKTSNKLNMMIKKISKIELSNLTLILAIPFTPAFVINIVCALTGIEFRKFFVAIIISKISLVAFWGFIGTSLLESLKNPKIILIILIILLVTYLISKIVSKKLNI